MEEKQVNMAMMTSDCSNESHWRWRGLEISKASNWIRCEFSSSEIRSIDFVSRAIDYCLYLLSLLFKDFPIIRNLVRPNTPHQFFNFVRSQDRADCQLLEMDCGLSIKNDGNFWEEFAPHSAKRPAIFICFPKIPPSHRIAWLWVEW
jgi:hypothetical protein